MRLPLTQRLRRGAVTLMAAVCLVGMLAVLALSLDAGGMMAERRRAQATADSAALAAASDLFQNYWTYSGADVLGTAKTSALSTAKANGYANDGTSSIVTVNIPPASGFFSGKRGYVEVVVEFRNNRAFSNVFGSGSIPVRARSVAVGTPIAVDVGILVLDPTQKAALNSQGSGTTTVTDTSVIVNSNNAAAAVAGGGGSMTAQKFVITGGYDTSGGGTFNGPIRQGAPPTSDPLSDLPVPDKSTMVVQANRNTHTTSGDLYLQPGVYRKGITVSGTGNLYLAPGIYYMDGGGFSFSGQGSLVGQGVMIYSNPGNGNADGISVTGQGSMVISAPTSGTYKGVTFFQDRTSNVTGNVQGTGGKTDISGTFYFAGAQLNIAGNGGVANIGSQYISDTLQLGGNGGINIQWQPDKVAQRRNLYLVE